MVKEIDMEVGYKNFGTDFSQLTVAIWKHVLQIVLQRNIASNENKLLDDNNNKFRILPNPLKLCN